MTEQQTPRTGPHIVGDDESVPTFESVGGDDMRAGVRSLLLGHQLYDLRSSGGGICAPLYSTGIPPSG